MVLTVNIVPSSGLRAVTEFRVRRANFSSGEIMMNRTTLLLSAIASIGLLSTVGAQAGITTFSGQDDGAPTSGPFTNSDATASSFLSAASGFGAVHTRCLVPAFAGADLV
jgi:hypothetical protein